VSRARRSVRQARLSICGPEVGTVIGTVLFLLLVAAWRGPSLLAANLASRLVVAQRNELGVTKVILASPLQELDLRDQDGLEPPTVLHLRSGQACAPATALRLGEIHERAILDLEPSKPLKQLLANDRRESVSGSGRVHQAVAFVAPEDERVECFCSDRIPPDHEFLPAVDALFCHAPDRRPASYWLSRRFTTSREVDADHASKAMCASQLQASLSAERTATFRQPLRAHGRSPFCATVRGLAGTISGTMKGTVGERVNRDVVYT